MKRTDVLGGLSKGLATIEAFTDVSDRLSITDVARSTGLDRATARRCLLTLVDGGYASFDGKFFTLTPKILRLGYSYLASARLPTLVQPFLDRLMTETDQPASSGVLDGHHVVHVARASQRRVMTANLSPGSRIPAYCSAMGRVLLSAMSDEQAEALVTEMDRRELTELTLTDVGRIMDQVRLTRERGYGAVDQEFEIGLCALAVPVRDPRGKVVAALNIGAQAYIKSMDRMIELHLDLMRRVRDSLQEIIP